MTKEFHLNGIRGRSIELEESKERLLVRTYDNQSVFTLDLKCKEALLKYQDCLELEAHFPEVSVFLYRCKTVGEDDCTAEEVKVNVRTLLKKEDQKHIRYAGRVLKIVDKDVYQIYTENLFVKFQDEVSTENIQQLFTQYEITVKRKLSFCENGYFVSVKEDTGQAVFDIAETILKEPAVALCHPELIVKRRNVFFNKKEKKEAPALEDDFNIDTRWSLDKVNVAEAWKTTKGRGAKICIIDDGIELGHRAFQGRLLCGKDMHAMESLMPDHKFWEEMHGTACTSIAASADESVMGVAPEALIMPIRQKGLGSVLEAEAFYWAAANGADVISCSWGPPDGDILDASDDHLVHYIPDHTRLAIDYATTKGRNGKGCVVLFAAGNGSEAVANDGYAAYDKVLAIGASNKLDQPTIYSDYGPPIFCMFPSGDYQVVLLKLEQLYGIAVADRIGIEGYSPNDYYPFFDGTSASCPGVAGVVALMLSVNPSLTRMEVKQILQQTCKKIGSAADYNQQSNTYSDQYGYGLVQADLAIQYALNFSNTSNPPIMNHSPKGYSLHIGINEVDQSYYGQITPLRFCINDAKDMKSLAQTYRFEQPIQLHNAAASRQGILDGIADLAKVAESGDLVWITYAGHGTQVANEQASDTEADGFDETWVAYDGLLLDDEIYRALGQFDKGVRVLLCSDSCHSGTVYREMVNVVQSRSISGGKNAAQFRWFDPSIAKALYDSDERGFYVAGKNRRAIDRETILASIISIGACKDDQLARELNGNGVFTNSIKELLKDQDFTNNYQAFTQTAVALINDPNQIPQINKVGAVLDTFFEIESPLFIGQQASLNEPIVEDVPINNFPNIPVLPTPTTAQTSFDNWTNYLLVYPKLPEDADVGLLNNQPKRVKIKPVKSEKEVWDAAYKYLLHADNRSEIAYVVPDFSHSGYETKLLEQTAADSRLAEKDNSGYLSTYPAPPADYAHKFRWHLDQDHSQLAKACSLVYPEINKGDVPQNTPQRRLVRIAHIDTGVSLSNPVLPVNFNENLSRSFVWGMPSFEDKETKIPIETQGHGDGTIGILAGNDFTFIDNNRLAKGYFGGNPFAEIISLKISETVALFSGKRFAQALRYAVDIGCDVVTMSMAGKPSPIMAEAINYAYNNGVVVVTAAGNSWHKRSGFWASKLPKSLLYPARYHRVIAAAAATFDHRPYIYEEQPQNRGMEAKYMQMNFGPEEDMKNTIAGYSPNIVWFGADGQYSLNGGGTSSSTPQIAAAASLFIQYYQDDLAQLIKDHPDKKYLKVEAVKKALYDSAKDFDLYGKYFGNGIVSAYDALMEPTKGEGNQTTNKHIWFTEIKNITPEAEAATSNNLLKQLFQAWGARSLDVAIEEPLQEMLSMELMELLYEDETLRRKLTESFGNRLTDLNHNEESFSVALDQELLLLLHNSDKASNFLKSRLRPISNVKIAPNIPIKDDLFYTPKKQSRTIETQWGKYILDCPTGSILEIVRTEGVEEEVPFVDVEIEIQPSNSRSLSDTSLYLSKLNTDEEVAIWIETTNENGVVSGHWSFPNFDDKSMSRTRDGAVWMYGKEAMTIAIPPSENTRGLGKIGKIVLKIIKLGGKLIGKHRFMVYDLSKPISDKKESRNNWENYEDLSAESKMAVDKIMVDSAAKLLILIPGLFSKVERGFDDFLTNSTNLDFIKNTYNTNYVFGLNMPTVLSGIVTNAQKITEALPAVLLHKKCDVIARSRGGVLARYLFEETLFDNPKGKPLSKTPLLLDKLVMLGTPNQGTPLAEYDNWKTMLNIATNLAIAAFSSATPVIATVSTIIKQVAENAEDLPGIADMNEASKVLQHLNKLTVDRYNYFAISSNFEPDWNKPIWKALDETSDRFIFKDKKSDWVSPVKSTYGEMNPIAGQTFAIPADRQFTVPSFENVNHFSYLSNEMVLENIRAWLSASNISGGNVLEREVVKNDVISPV